MNRREWLQRAAIAAGVLAVDPERLLWEPGKKTIFIPPVLPYLTEEDLRRAIEYLQRQPLQQGDYYILVHPKWMATRARLTVDEIIVEELSR